MIRTGVCCANWGRDNGRAGTSYCWSLLLEPLTDTSDWALSEKRPMNGWRRMSLFWLRHPTWAWDALAIKSEISSLGKWINSHNTGGCSLQSPFPIFHHWVANLTRSSHVGRCSSVFGCLLSCPVEHPGHQLLRSLPPKPVLIFKPQVLFEAERNKSLKSKCNMLYEWYGLSSYTNLTKSPKKTTLLLLNTAIYFPHMEFSSQFWIFLMDALTEKHSKNPFGPVSNDYRSLHQSLGPHNSGISTSGDSVLLYPNYLNLLDNVAVCSATWG